MFKWWKRRKQVKKMKSLRDKISLSVGVLETIRDETIIGEVTDTKPIVSNADITNVVDTIKNIIKEIDIEVGDRTRKREFLFKEIEEEEDHFDIP